jgi:hypothetical protein
MEAASPNSSKNFVEAAAPRSHFPFQRHLYKMGRASRISSKNSQKKITPFCTPKHSFQSALLFAFRDGSRTIAKGTGPCKPNFSIATNNYKMSLTGGAYRWIAMALHVDGGHFKNEKTDEDNERRG